MLPQSVITLEVCPGCDDGDVSVAHVTEGSTGRKMHVYNCPNCGEYAAFVLYDCPDCPSTIKENAQ